MTNPIHLFIGPTLAIAKLTLPSADFILHPPAVAGSIAHLLEEYATPSCIAIVDGWIGEDLAISHRELLSAQKKGWQLWGLADMGAIRAYELRDLGMQGFGSVYDNLNRNPDMNDANILWHCTKAPHYTLLAEPMIHWQDLLSYLVDSKQISHTERQEICARLQQEFYKKLSHKWVENIFLHYVPHLNFISALEWLNNNRMKIKDLNEFIQLQPWQ